MQYNRLYNTTDIKKQNTDIKTTNYITSNYKIRREELNQIVKRHVAKQKQKTIHNNNAILNN